MGNINSVRAALETALNAITPALATVWENTAYTPVDGTAYQRVYLMTAEPDNSTYGATYYREQGIFQITLFYPIQTGTKDAADRAELIRTKFKRGSSFTSGSVTVIIDRTPEISQGRIDENRWALPVKIRFYAGIT